MRFWGEKSSEKTILAIDKANLTSKENGEAQALLAEKEKLEKDLKRLNDKLAFALSDCNAKDEQVKKQTKIVQEAVAGWEKAEAEMLSMKQDLDEAMQQLLLYEERVAHLDGALKECMQQLRFGREEQQQRIHDAVMKASEEFEQTQMVLEEQLSETSKRLAKSGLENSHLNKYIVTKENLIEDLKRQLAQAEADHNALMIRLESTEKDNTCLKYETQVLEKELYIRNEERELYRRTADASHKQYLESVKKIAKLESECQRLRGLAHKRLPSPAALAKMKNEIEILRQDSLEMRRKKLNSTSLVVESSVDSSPAIRQITTLTEKLCAVEKENKNLRESLNRKTNEVQFSRVMLARTASKLLQLESQIESKSQATLGQPSSNLALQEFSMASMSDSGSDDKVSCAESCASALISELEHFRSGKQKESLSCKSVEPSDINLMDDFAEMEKLALVSVEKAPEISHVSLESTNEIDGFSDRGPSEITSEVIGKDIFPVSDHLLGFSTSNQETCSIDVLKGNNIPGWLQDVEKVILEQNCVTHKNPDDILEDIRLALRYLNNLDRCGFDSSKGSGQVGASNPPHFGHQTSWEPLNDSVVDPPGEVNDAEISSMKRIKQQSQRDLSKSITKIIELIEGISMPAEDNDNSDPLCQRDGKSRTHKNQRMPTNYIVRVFQWKTSELSNVLQHFLQVCYDLLNAKADHEKFAAELTTALDWTMNHCFSLQDVSSMRDAIKKQFDWDETQSENEAEIGLFEVADKLHLPSEQLSCLPALTNSDCHELPAEEMQYDEKGEFENIKDKEISSESEKEALEGRLQSAKNQRQESEKTIASLRLELQTLKESNGMLGDQIQNHAFANADLDVQLTESELKEVHHKVLALEVELENKNLYCEELETRCVEIQLQLESMTQKCSNDDITQKDKPPQTGWEITAASEKLADCQETIIHLGKQLKATAAPKDASLFDNVIANHRHTITNKTTVPLKDMKVKNRCSLLDMLADDDIKAKVCKASDRNSSPNSIPGFIQPQEKILVLNGLKSQDDSATVNSLDIVPAKKSGGRNLWKRLLGRKKKAKKKNLLSF